MNSEVLASSIGKHLGNLEAESKVDPTVLVEQKEPGISDAKFAVIGLGPWATERRIPRATAGPRCVCAPV
jgi:hypothetical protein